MGRNVNPEKYMSPSRPALNFKFNTIVLKN